MDPGRPRLRSSPYGLGVMGPLRRRNLLSVLLVVLGSLLAILNYSALTLSSNLDYSNSQDMPLAVTEQEIRSSIRGALLVESVVSLAPPRVLKVLYETTTTRNSDDGTLGNGTSAWIVEAVRGVPSVRSSATPEAPLAAPRRREPDRTTGPATEEKAPACVPNAEWQTHHFPTCNLLHERVPYGGPYSHTTHDGTTHDLFRKLGNGYFRDVWRVGYPEISALKTLRQQHDVEQYHMDRSREEAMVMQQLTGSPYVANIYAYCSTTGLFEFAEGGDMKQVVLNRRNKLTPLRKLQIAVQAAIGLAAVHSIDSEHRATVVHADLSTNQFIFTNGRYKLNDFNLARILYRNTTDESRNCPYRFSFVIGHAGNQRSPEEYRFDPLTEKTDVFAFGNILHTLLHQKQPFTRFDQYKAAEMLSRGERWNMSDTILESTDPAIVAMRNMTVLCHTHEPERRPTMPQVRDYLMAALEQVDPGRIEQWRQQWLEKDGFVVQQ